MKKKNGKTFIEESLQSVLFYLLTITHPLPPLKGKQVQPVTINR